MRTRKRRFALAVVLATLGSLGILSLEGYLPHTDDGCAVEVHCLACRAHLGAGVSLAPVLTLSAGLAAVGMLSPEAAGSVLDASIPAHSSRGPPPPSTTA
jgi:hypothetical protein